MRFDKDLAGSCRNDIRVNVKADELEVERSAVSSDRGVLRKTWSWRRDRVSVEMDPATPSMITLVIGSFEKLHRKGKVGVEKDLIRGISMRQVRNTCRRLTAILSSLCHFSSRESNA